MAPVASNMLKHATPLNMCTLFITHPYEAKAFVYHASNAQIVRSPALADHLCYCRHSNTYKMYRVVNSAHKVADLIGPQLWRYVSAIERNRTYVGPRRENVNVQEKGQATLRFDLRP